MILRRKMLLLFHVIILSCASALGSSSNSSYVTIGDNNITTTDIKGNPYYNITSIPIVRKYIALLKKGNTDKRELSPTNNRALFTSNSKTVEHFTTWSYLDSSGEISNRSHQFRAKMQRPESSWSTSAIWKARRRRRNIRYPRDTSGQEMDGKPVIAITVHIRNRRASVKDFTQVNKNVCPPSLCRIADERSRGGVGRPRGTGGTVFYQGDIVLDRNLDRFIYPRTTSTPSQQMRRRNQNGSRKSSQSRRRRKNNKQSRGSNGKRSKTNRRRPKIENKEEESSKVSDDRLKRNNNKLSRNVKSGGKRRRAVKENIKRRTKRSSGSGSWDESEADAGGSQWHKQERSGRTRRATMKLRNRLWKNGVAIYKMAREINPEAKRVIRGAINHIQQRTCIRFREKKSSDRDFIRFISEPG
ncbi:metalloendopeptidase [Plakobranchus ocellatus]|uniref:Metalloendopeptidase n=1 Tax=Plakobranchus ocellatus TaxID=259542 RepID=A0AAV3YJE1_9GAST|nr:metalloendopeptidase [Plakobranchus ocellatus]